MVTILRWLNDHDGGDGVSIGVRALAAELGMPVQPVVNHLKWLKAFGAVRSYVEQTIGQGRKPNRYVPVFTVEEWLEHGPAIAADLRQRMGGKPIPPRPRPPLRVVPEVAEAEAELEEHALTCDMDEDCSCGVVERLEPHVAAPLAADELDAWASLR
jgi:hypothetical protein